jgi:hypothetical protein
MALITEIMQTIAQPISELAIWLDETYQVDINLTISKWLELTGMNITVKNNEIALHEVQSLNIDSTKSPKSNKKIPKTKDVCQHIFLSGQKTGEQCTTKPKNGAIYCSAHRPKNSVKSVKTNKKKVVKNVEKIDSEFASDSEDENKPSKTIKDSNKKGKKEVKKIKKTNGDTSIEDSDMEALSDLDISIKPLLKKKGKNDLSKSLKNHDTDEEIDKCKSDIADLDLDLSDNE